jgi:Tfp pilus assembly protein PilF
MGTPYAYEHLIRADIYADRNMPEEAIKQIKLAIKSDPADFYLKTKLANLLTEQGQWARAELQLAKAIMLNPVSITPWLALADLYAAEGNLKKASDAALQAVHLNIDNCAPFAWLGNYYLKIGNSRMAHQYFKKAIKSARCKITKTAFFKKAGELAERRHYGKEAAFYFEQYLHAGGTDNKIVTKLANNLIEQGNIENGIKLMEIVLSKNPQKQKLRIKLIKILLERHLFNKAFFHAESLSMDSDDMIIKKANFIYMANRPYMAKRLITEHFGLIPKNKDARYLLFQIALELKQLEFAKMLKR